MTRPGTVLTILCLSLLLTFCSGSGATIPAPSFGDAPSWFMVAHTGTYLSSEDLRGKIYLANFIWTNCRDTCPTLSLQMSRLQDRLKQTELLGEKVVLVSFSFDSERDTPERLNKYARLFKAEPEGWFFLTGNPDEVYRVVTQGFGVSYRPFTAEDIDQLNLADDLERPEGAAEDSPNLADVIGAEHIGEFLDIDRSVDYEHQNVFILVDATGNIHRYYIDTFLDADRVMSDVRSLLGN